MRTVLFFFYLFSGIVAFGQENESVSDSTETSNSEFTQVGLITNRTFMTFEDNPALAGFDRKLNVSYQYSAQNLAIGIPNDNGDLVLAFQQHSAMIDMAFGGSPQNWGVGFSYRNVKEGNLSYQKGELAHSFRIKIKKHNIIIGVNYGLLISDLHLGALTFGDEIDPRWGIIYPTNEIPPASTSVGAVMLGAGLRYYWKKLSFDYSFQLGPTQFYAFKGVTNDPNYYHKIKASYSINIDRRTTLTPELLVFNHYTHGWRFTPALTIQHRNLAFGQLAFYSLNQFGVKLGYQFKNLFTVTAGSSMYLDSETSVGSGLASVEIGARFQFNTRKY